MRPSSNVPSRPRALRFAGIVAMMLALLAGVMPARAAKKKSRNAPTCTKKKIGTSEVTTLSARAGSNPTFVLQDTHTTDAASKQVTEHTVVKRQKQTVLDITAGTDRLTFTFGHGFKGIHHVDVTREGTMLRAVVDGRRTVAFPPGARPASVTFEDGKPAPKLRVSGVVRRALLKFKKVDSTTCALVTPADGAPCLYTDSFGECDKFPGCNGCGDVCFGIEEECALDAVAGAALCPFCAVVTGGGCLYSLKECADACNAPGHECCPVGCGNFCGAKGTVCCGNDACPAEECCGGTNPFCCGSGEKCIDAAKGLCCAQDHGDVCFNGNGCCPSAQSCLDGISGQVCCPAGDATCGADDACCPSGQCCHTTECCGAGQECLDRCCDPADACGTTCCPSHNCLNGNKCCDPPDQPCGGNCCGPFTACCNGQCCPGNDTCVNGSCCPLERTCGSTCCAPGFACTNPALGTCQACPVAQAPCAAGQGNPLCCPGGSECCGDGSCCNTSANMTCCSIGGIPGCHPQSQCIR